MTHQAPADFGNVPSPSAPFGSLPQDAETFGTVPQPSEAFGKIPHASETFGKVPNPAERRESHTLTVREAARMFEAAGVARTERSITNWCQPVPSGVSRLDAYFDPNDRKYFITQQSVESAIAEEKAKATKNAGAAEAFRTVPNASEAFGNVRKEGEATAEKPSQPMREDADKVKELEKEVMDLRILNAGKDYFIDQLKKERDGMTAQLIETSREVGQLETKLLQIEERKPRRLSVQSLHFKQEDIAGEGESLQE